MGTRVACGQCHDNSVTPGVDRSPGGGYGRAKVGQGGGSYGEDRGRASRQAVVDRAGTGEDPRVPGGGGAPVPATPCKWCAPGDHRRAGSAPTPRGGAAAGRERRPRRADRGIVPWGARRGERGRRPPAPGRG